MTRSLYLAVALSLSIGLAACDSAAPLGPAEALGAAGDSLDAILTAAAGSTDGRSDDGARSGSAPLFDELATAIPGFGGLYRVRPCAVVVVLTDLGDREHAFAVVRRTLAPLVARTCPDGVNLSAEHGQFTYAELRRFLEAARPLIRIDGVAGIMIDFKLNRLVVAVASRRAARAVTDALPQLGIPAKAVVFQAASTTTRPPVPDQV